MDSPEEKRVPAIRLSGLKKRYGTGEAAVDALKGVDMTVWPGEVDDTVLVHIEGGEEEIAFEVVLREGFGQDYRIDRIGPGSAVYRKADEPSAHVEPVVLPLIHDVILHLASTLFN